MLQINRGDKILFTGDSITDCGSSLSEDINFLGHGYPVFIASLLGVRRPELELNIINTGITGDRIADLADRWQRDVLNHKPDVLSVLIGINDCSARYSTPGSVSSIEYGAIYRDLLTRTRKNLPETRIVLMEPFLLPLQEEQRNWRTDLNLKIQTVRDLAEEFSCLLIPLDGIFAAAACRREKSFWTKDGIHPTPAGHALIAENWIEAADF